MKGAGEGQDIITITNNEYTNTKQSIDKDQKERMN
jgi:hypothetical protein